MDSKYINKILKQTAYVRLGGTEQERQCAEYIAALCSNMGLSAKTERFELKMFNIETARLVANGIEIPCTGYLGAPNSTVVAKLYYLQSTQPALLKKCKDRVVIIDKPLGFKLYDMVFQNGAKGIITFNGNVNLPDNDIDIKRIGFSINSKNKIPVVNVHISSALRLIKMQGKICELCIKQSEYTGCSQNLVLDVKGESEKTIVITAHYDTTALSVGAYDNMSGVIGLLYLAEYFSKRKNRLSIRLVWCGSEEQGLIGSLEYCKRHHSELKDILLNINLDMIGSVLGEFNAFSCADEQMKERLESFLKRHRFGGVAKHQIRSSDSNSFVFFGVPAVSFARYAPASLGQIHTRYDTAKILTAKSLLKDIRIITAFTENLQQNFEVFTPINISEKIKTDVENYMQRKAYPVWIEKEIYNNDK